MSSHRLVVTLCSVALVFILGGFAWSYFALRGLSGNPLILHFNDVSGITSVGGLGMIFFMAAFGTLVAAVNFAIALEFDARNKLFGKFLAAMTLVFAVLLFIAFAAIINVNV